MERSLGRRCQALVSSTMIGPTPYSLRERVLLVTSIKARCILRWE